MQTRLEPKEEGSSSNRGDERLLKVAIEREPLRVAKQWGYEVHRLSPKDIIDKEEYARGYRYRLSKADPTQPYPQIVMARSEGEVATFLKRQIEGGNPVAYREGEGQAIARQLGEEVHYEGPQYSRDIFEFYLFTDTITGTTFAASTLEEAKRSLIKHRKAFQKEGNPMPRTESERQSFHERIFGKGSTPPLERLGRGQTVNALLPMPPESGPPLPRVLGIRWPWVSL